MPGRSETSTTYVAFVRAVMLGRDGLHRQVLLELVRAAGASDATSYITTGNVSFRARPGALGRIVARLEAGIGDLVGRPTEVFVRSVDDLMALRAGDPFADPPLDGAHERLVSFLTAAPDLELPYWSPARDVVVFGAGPRELFSAAARFSDGTSRGPGGLIERATGTRVTTRSWSTVERILAKLT